MRRAARGHLLVAIAVFAIALVGLFALRAGEALHPPYPRARAEAAAMRDPGVAGYLRAHPFTRAEVIALDRQDWRVTFFDGQRLVLDAAVGPAGTVTATEEHASGHPPGSSTFWTPWLIVLFAAVFVLAVAGQPLRSLRNLDAVVIASGFTISMLLLDARLVAAHIYIGIATLAYVAWRCAQVGLSPEEEVVHRALYRRFLGRADAGRVITFIGAGLLVAGVILTVTSTGASDVDAAGLAGATLLNHGVMPYGHLPAFIVHGDTYPLLTYVLYMPFAAIDPVRDAFDSIDGGLWLNAIALVLGAWGLDRRGGRTFAVAWLAFPPVLLAATGGGNDVPTACFVIAALLAFDRALGGTALLALAGWVKIVPAAALVVWIPRLPRRRALEALALVAVILVAGVAAILVVGGGSELSTAVRALRFQFVRGSWYSLWQQLGARWLQVVVQAATLAFAVAAALWVAAAPRGTFGLRRIAALAGALIAMLQLAGNYWTYAYLPWLLPFILVALFPPEPRRSPQPGPLVP